MTAEERLLEAGWEGITILKDYDYDSALIGVTHDGRAVYDFDKMVEWIAETEGCSYEDAMEWVDYNTIRALGYFGSDSPIVMYRLEEA